MFLFRPNNNQKDGVEEIGSGVVETVEENYGNQKLLLSAPVSIVRQASCFTTAVLQLQGKKLSEKK